jgi:arylformamidase
MVVRFRSKKLPKIIDISVPLEVGMPAWPGSPGFQIYKTLTLESGGDANISQLDTDVHIGTHVDAPCHFITGGAAVEDLSLEVLIGSTYVANLPELTSITAKDLEALELPEDTSRLLLKTRNSELWQQGVQEFKSDFVALTADAAEWVVKHHIKLIGVDYLSVQRYKDSPLTHEILLEAGVIILEGVNLTNVDMGVYQLICLPLKLVGSDGAPARTVLVKE